MYHVPPTNPLVRGSVQTEVLVTINKATVKKYVARLAPTHAFVEGAGGVEILFALKARLDKAAAIGSNVVCVTALGVIGGIHDLLSRI